MSTHALRAGGFLGPEFNEFLFESIGQDQYGRPLSVVSALARLDLDAWAEAATLARLPHDIAADKLSTFIRRFTECPQMVRDSHKIAVRLIALLPGRTASAGQKAVLLPAAGDPKNLMQSAIMFALIMAVLVGVEMLAATTHAPAPPPASTLPAQDVVPH